MTTFKLCVGGWLKIIALVGVTTFSMCAAAADDLHTTARMSMTNSKQTCGKLLIPASDNRYVLLLFFSRDAKIHDAVRAFFHQDDMHPVGCMTDPDPGSTAKIVVQGSCPTDCAHPKLDDKRAESYIPGDPLSRIKPSLEYPMIHKGDKAVWALFSADSNGIYEAGDGGDVNFEVWQILAKDSCHAGNILNSLKTSAPDVFSPTGGYIGQLMVGYTPREKYMGSHSRKDCKPLTVSSP